jgi:DNA primase large subunit
MISVTSVTDRYILQPTLLAKHRKTLEWLSSTVLWKRELAFFQKLLDQFAKNFQSTEDKKKIDHFQNLIVYYNGELADSLASRLRQHEKKLAETLESRDESKTEYFMEHDALMNELESFNNRFVQIKGELFSFVESAM